MCLLVKEGLFLPMSQHVALYCVSSSYASCSYYQRLGISAQDEGRQREMETAVNRRRSIRIPNRYTFRFVGIADSGPEDTALREADAWTVDISGYGLRFACRQPLSKEALISFSLGGDASVTGIRGTGRVVWCKPLDNSDCFQAGMVFVEPAKLLIPSLEQSSPS